MQDTGRVPGLLGIRFRVILALQALLLIGCRPTSSGQIHNQTNPDEGALRCESPAWKAGEVKRLALLEHVYTVTNVSDREVVLKGVRSNCGCFVPKPSSLRLSPGQSLEIPVQFQAPPTPGSFRRSVFVDVLKPELQVVELSVDCEVMVDAGLYSAPTRLDFGAVTAGSLVERELVVMRHDRSPVRLRTVAVDKGKISVTGDIVSIQGSGGGKIRLRFDSSDLPAGESMLNIQVFTAADKPHDVLEIPALIRVAGEYSFISSIYIPDLGKSESREIVLAKDASRRGCVRAWHYSGDDRLRVECVDPETATPPVVSVSLNPAIVVPAGTIMTGKLSLNVDGMKDRLEIPVVVALRK